MSLLLLLNNAPARQFAQPDEDGTVSGVWTITGAATGWQALAGTSPDLSTFVASPNNPSATEFYGVRFAPLNPPTEPGDLIIRVTADKDSGNRTIEMNAELRQGDGTVIGTLFMGLLNSNNPTTYEVALAPAQFAAVTDWSDLRIRLNPTTAGGGSGSVARLYWVSLEAPFGAASTTATGSGLGVTGAATGSGVASSSATGTGAGATGGSGVPVAQIAVSDNYDRVDAASIATNAPFTWVLVSGGAFPEIAANQASQTSGATGTRTLRANIDVGGTTTFARTTVTSMGGVQFTQHGPMVHMDATASTGYMLMLDRPTATTLAVRLRKQVADVRTDLTANVTVASLPATLEVRAEPGGVVKGYLNGVLVAEATDTSPLTATALTGVYYLRNQTWDDFEAGLVVPVPSPVVSGSGTATTSEPAAGATGTGAGTTAPVTGAGTATTTTPAVGTLTTRFDGAALPSGWTEYDPDNWGDLSFASGRLVITPTVTTNKDSISSVASVERSVGVEHAITTADLDVAVRVDGTGNGDHGDVLQRSLNLLVIGDTTGEMVRASIYQGGVDNERLTFYGYARAAGAGAVWSNNNATFDPYFGGAPNWIRLKYTSATGVWQYLHSSDGFTWLDRRDYDSATPIVPTATRAFTPRRFVVGFSNGGGQLTPMRVGRVVDMLTAGTEDLREAPPTRTARLVSSIDPSLGALPAGWVTQNLGSTFSTSFVPGALRMQSTASATSPNTAGDRAAIRWTGEKARDWRLYVAAASPTASSNFYFAPGMGREPQGTAGLTTDGALDQYTYGGGYSLEVQLSTIRRPIRQDDDSDAAGTNPVAPYMTGLNEAPYAHLKNLTFTALQTGGTHHFLFERSGGRYRIKEWTGLRSAEPAEWNHYDGDDFINDFAMAPWIALSYNNISGAGDATVDLQAVEFYALDAPGGASGAGVTTPVTGSGAATSLATGTGAGTTGPATGSGAAEASAPGVGAGVAAPATGSGATTAPEAATGAGAGVTTAATGAQVGGGLGSGPLGTMPLGGGAAPGAVSTATGAGAGTSSQSTGSGTGTVEGQPVTGGGAGTAGQATGSGAASTGATGTGAGVTTPSTGAGAGAMGAAGTGSGTAGQATGSGTASSQTAATGAGTTGQAAGSGAASSRSTGTGAGATGAATGAGSAAARATGGGVGTAGSATGSGAASSRATGTGAGTAAPTTGSGAAAARATGSGAGTTGAAVGSGTGATEGTTTGTGAGTTRPTTGSGAGTSSATGSGAGVAGAATGTGAAAARATGTGAAGTAPATATGTGSTTAASSGAGSTTPVVGSGTGGADSSGSGGGVATQPTGSGAGSVRATGSGAGEVGETTGEGAGESIATGGGVGQVDVTVGAGAGAIEVVDLPIEFDLQVVTAINFGVVPVTALSIGETLIWQVSA